MPRDLTISLINHSNPDMLRDCLRSLYKSAHEVTFDVWVIDNATDGCLVSELREEFPEMRWFFNKQRMGFSTNHNQVLAISTSRYTCILNDDTIIHDGAFDALVRYMDANPRVGMVGPRVLNPDGSQQNCAFRFLSLWTELISITLMPRFMCHIKHQGCHPAQNGLSPALVDWVLGACIVVRDKALREIGLLDDVLSPIANTEEVDWCYRAREAGWDVGYCPSAVITHIGGQSMKSPEASVDKMRVEMHRTRLAFFRKHYGAPTAVVLSLLYRAMLPWNMIMLSQSMRRGRISRSEYDNASRTLIEIARLRVPTMPLQDK
ncbi:MAG: glycosyltransferase family 2 protein [Capsulimonadaceae bacterium]|nr:glycosyltransferase family 2 protein [Capsulimonadaceae bacterium]